jgi:hypothetical protein
VRPPLVPVVPLPAGGRPPQAATPPVGLELGSSVRERWGGCGDLHVCIDLTGELGRWWPAMTVVVRCGPVVRGPDVAPAVPRWKHIWLGVAAEPRQVSSKEKEGELADDANNLVRQQGLCPSGGL